MRGKFIATVFTVCLALPGLLGTALAQEGHPMTGSWVGEWSTEDGGSNRVVVILDWTGSEITGTINPGPNAIPIETAEVNPNDWSLHFEAVGDDGTRYVVDGSLDDLGTYNRTLAGTWNVGDVTGEFSITRQ